MSQEKSRNNPWQVLVMAGLFFVPGIFLLLAPGSVLTMHMDGRGVGRPPQIIPLHFLQLGGAAALAVAAILVGFYFWLCAEIARGPRAKNVRRNLFNPRFVHDPNRNDGRQK